MSNKMKHDETVHINELTRTAKGTVQWFLDKENSRDGAYHPITHNNQLELFTNGEKGFERIAGDIARATSTIDLCCWGFDPGMELVRGAGAANSLWPRGPTFGDLLIAASNRGVKVRLLVWIAPKSSALRGVNVNLLNPKNAPGWSHDAYVFSFGIKQAKVGEIDAAKILEAQRKANQPPNKLMRMAGFKADDDNTVARKARAIYCNRWFLAGRRIDGKFANIAVRDRQSTREKVIASLASEKNFPDLTEWVGMTELASHHQKTILIDYAADDGKNAVGYVMGLNSVTDYWDTDDHDIENPRREDGTGSDREIGESVQALTPEPGAAAAQTDAGFRSYKPYRDYACRLQGGGALIAVHENFESAWLRDCFDPDDKTLPFAQAELRNEVPPAALMAKAKPGNSSVQIVRTQPDESDKTIKDMYFQATSVAIETGGYMYIENQYFQYEEWSQLVIKQAKAKAALWKSGAKKSGRGREDMPVTHVFIVIPVAEREQMVPRTYDALAILGQQSGMTGQNTLIADANEKARLKDKSLPDVVEHANAIPKPTPQALEGNGLRVVASMLQTSGACVDLAGQRRMRYREIYIHSKLMLVNDSFFTLGSANLNTRSMASDSELNMGCNDRKLTRALRAKIWSQLSRKEFNGGKATQAELRDTYEDWKSLQNSNRNQKIKNTSMIGFLLPIEDNRSATIRLG